MQWCLRMRPAALLLAVLTAGATAACAKNTIKADGAARSVVQVVTEQTGFRPTDVRCPSGVEAKVGGTFDCRFTGPEGPYVAHMGIIKVDGERVVFDIRTRPSG